MNSENRKQLKKLLPKLANSESLKSWNKALKNVADGLKTQSDFELLPKVNYEKEILKELKELKNKKSNTSQSVVLEFNIVENQISRRYESKILTYNLQDRSKRTQLLKILYKNTKYIKTDSLRELLTCPNDAAVSNMIRSLNSKIKASLHLKSKLIVGKRGSGYRISSDILIETVK